MNPNRSETKLTDTGTPHPTGAFASTEAILGRVDTGETPDKIRHIPPNWVKHHRQLLALRGQLEAERRDLASAARQPLETFSLHIADRATDEFEHNLALCQLSHEQDALYEINQALKRIENGTYGFCELSGKPIPEARLNALPWARFALEAEQQLERERAVNSVHLGELRSVARPIPRKADIIAPGEEQPPWASEETLTPLSHPISSRDSSQSRVAVMKDGLES
jgi:RNA polymerase-binding protein DksA